jgi:hypothetical protein
MAIVGREHDAEDTVPNAEFSNEIRLRHFKTGQPIWMTYIRSLFSDGNIEFPLGELSVAARRDPLCAFPKTEPRMNPPRGGSSDGAAQRLGRYPAKWVIHGRRMLMKVRFQSDR